MALPTGREHKKLGEIGKPYSGLSGKSKQDFGSGMPYITYMNIFKNTFIDENNVDYVKIKRGERQNKVQTGDMFFTISSETPEELGMSSVLLENSNELYLNSFCFGFRPFDLTKVIPEYMGYFLRSENIRHIIYRFAQGSTRYNLSKNFLLNGIDIVFPTSPVEQAHIASILSTIDEEINSTQAVIDKYRAIKQGLMADLFLPKAGWEEKPLNHYLKYISYGFTNPMPETEEGPYMVTALNVNGGIIKYDTCRKTSQQAFDKLLTKKSRPEKDDVLITKDGTLGRVALVNNNNLCINQSVAVLKSNDLIYPLFLKYLLESPSYQKRILDDAGGSTIKHIYITILDKMLVNLPKNVAEQKQIASILLSIDETIAKEQATYDKLQMMKKGLMSDLLSGKVRVL